MTHQGGFGLVGRGTPGGLKMYPEVILVGIPVILGPGGIYDPMHNISRWWLVHQEI